MSDILERLKVWQSEFRWLHDSPAGQMLLEATAEIERLRAENAELREAARMMGDAISAREEAVRIETEWGNGRKITKMEVDAAWGCAESARAACEANPIARAAIDAAGGGEEANR